MIKRTTVIIFVIAMSFVAVYLASCQKDKSLTQKQEIGNADQKIEQQIIQFKNQMSDTKKSDEIVELDSAIWYINSALNYSYTFPYIEYYNYYIDSAFVTMKISDDAVTLTELVKTYRNIEKVMREHFFSIENTNKHLVTIDIEETDNCENSTIEFKIISEVGVYNTEKSTNMSNTDNPFGSTDWWSFAFGNGKCHGYSGGAGWDAAKKISYAVRNKLLPNSIMYYFTDPKVFWEILPYSSSSIPNGMGYYLYWGTSCVSPQNMNYYYNRLLEVVDYYKPAGKTFQNVILKGSYPTGIEKGDNAFHYIYKLSYGIKHKREMVPENPCW